MAVADSADVLKKSVTVDDVMPGAQPFGIFNFLSVNLGLKPTLLQTALPDLSLEWTYDQDLTLARTVLYQGDWASAISIAITKMSSLSWESTAKAGDAGQARLRVKRANEMFHAVNLGKGWVNFLSQHLRDFLTCCNGAIIEVIRATKGYGSKIIGLCHLDSRRCYRTGNPDTPIIYVDRLGREHVMKWYQVIMISDMPDPGALFFDVGLSAAFRAYERIRYQAVIDRYLIEKVGGFGSNALVFLNGVSDTALKAAILQGDEARKRRGSYTYRGATMIPVVDAEKFEKMVVELASLPDGFNYKDELAITLQKYANAIGLDVQDLMPLSGQGFGTGAQSWVLENKSKGRGLASWQQDFTHLMNDFVLPDSVTFAFSEMDLRDEQQTATVNQIQLASVTAAVQGGVLTALEGKQLLADWQVIPDSFLPEDETPETTLSSEEKVDEDPADVPPANPDLQATPQPPASPGAGVKPGDKVNGIVSQAPGQLPWQP